MAKPRHVTLADFTLRAIGFTALAVFSVLVILDEVFDKPGAALVGAIAMLCASIWAIRWQYRCYKVSKSIPE